MQIVNNNNSNKTYDSANEQDIRKAREIAWKDFQRICGSDGLLSWLEYEKHLDAKLKTNPKLLDKYHGSRCEYYNNHKESFNKNDKYDTTMNKKQDNQLSFEEYYSMVRNTILGKLGKIIN